ncbi:MAG: tripartite tricarboxylate transporter TctB family protein [Chloroflexota bacterium]|nr:tripartite tricarboxylate transporter TctB family protein [Chloroflexota bacterium]
MDRRQALSKALPDILAGAIFVAFGLSFALQSLTYEVGTPFRMGPGFFPLLLGGLVAILGVAIVASGFASEQEESVGGVPWRGLVLITVAFMFFALTVRGLGVVPSLFVTTTLAGLASVRVRPLTAVIIAAGLTATSVIVFIIALQLRLPLFGPWIPI